MRPPAQADIYNPVARVAPEKTVAPPVLPRVFSRRA